MTEIRTSIIQLEGMLIEIIEGGKQVARGYLCIVVNNPDGEIFGLATGICVQPEERGKGYGKAIRRRIEEEAMTAGCSRVVGIAPHGQEHTRKLYDGENAGFTSFGEAFQKKL